MLDSGETLPLELAVGELLGHGLALALLHALEEASGLCVGESEPLCEALVLPV